MVNEQALNGISRTPQLEQNINALNQKKMIDPLIDIYICECKGKIKAFVNHIIYSI